MAITNVGVALAVINEAKTHGIFAEEMPESESAKIAQANELLALAQQAQAAGVQGAPVMAVLAAAAQQPGTPPPATGNPFGGAPAPVAAPVAVPAPVAAPAPAAPDINAIIPGYDDLKVAEIMTSMESLNPDQIEFVKAYEREEGERSKILTFQPPAPVPVAAPPTPALAPVAAPPTAAPASVDPAMYASTEPWAGYSKAKIADIMTTLEDLYRTQGAEQAKNMLAHVWEYESNNKERTRLINKLKEIATNGVAPAGQAVAPVASPDPVGVNPTPPFQQGEMVPAPAPVPPQAAPNAFVPPPAPAVLNQGPVTPLQGATQNSMTMIDQEGLPIPHQVAAPPTLPEDFTALSSVEVRQYQSKFNACQARAHYLLSIAEGHASDAKIVADKLVSTFIRSTEFPAKTTVTQMEASASENADVAEARRIQVEFSEQARQLRALRDIYQHTCERLSREQTGRSDEAGTVR